MSKILYIDDERDNLITIKAGIKKWYDLDILEHPVAALEKMQSDKFEIVITDQRMPDMTGLELAKKINENYPATVVIILTAYDDNKTMLNAINQGGIYRYLLKPVDIIDLKQTLDSALAYYQLNKQRLSLINNLIDKNRKLSKALEELELLQKQLEEENIQLKQEVGKNDFLEIVGTSKSLMQVLGRIELVAKSDSTVLLLGESGTGKELFANAIHRQSRRKDSIFIKVNCAAIPENLLESELFGYEKGAFTGAVQTKPGKFELANKGTIFLDEIGELPLVMQSKILRVIQEKEVERLGSNSTRKIDIRIIAATNRNLEEEVVKGHFRADLFYRLNVVPVQIPSLQSRKEDIPALVNFFIEKCNRKEGKRITSISSADMQKLMEYHWPGNIRELENIIERSHILSSGTKLKLDPSFGGSRTDPSIHGERMLTMRESEFQTIERTLKNTKWKIKGPGGAAEILGINPSTLTSRIKKLGIERPV